MADLITSYEERLNRPSTPAIGQATKPPIMFHGVPVEIVPEGTLTAPIPYPDAQVKTTNKLLALIAEELRLLRKDLRDTPTPVVSSSADLNVHDRRVDGRKRLPK